MTYGYDGHGSVRFLTDVNGNVTDTLDYDAFGILVDRTGNTPLNYMYAGEQWDSDLGMYFLRARYMNQNTGRFFTMDSYEGNNRDPLSLHKYLYTKSNAIDLIDPSGYNSTTAEFGVFSTVAQILAAIPLPSLASILPIVRGAAILISSAVVIDIIEDQVGKTAGSIAGAAAAASSVQAALLLLRTEFEKFRKRSEFNRSSKHFAELWFPSPPIKTPRVNVGHITVSSLTIDLIEGGRPGRIFQFVYRVGPNATLGGGLFRFRLDYLAFDKLFDPATRLPIPVYDVHYHLEYGNINVDHEGI